MKRVQLLLCAVCVISAAVTSDVDAQAFGIELHNTVMPASGGMGGASIALPQDVQSAVAGNPATLAQFHGTQFSTGGVWVEPTYNLQHTGNVLPGLSPFSGRSEAEGSALGGFAVAQDLRAMGKPVTVGAGLFGTAGAGSSFNYIQASNGTSTVLSVLTIVSAVGVELTDRLDAGASLQLGTGNLYGPFTGINAAAYDYALRGSVGASYEVTDATTLGAYYQTKQEFNFDDVIRLQLLGGTFGTFQDIDLDMPQNVGLGFANRSLMNGQLLLAVDVLYKNWEDTAFLGALLEDQWVFQLGTQYSLNDRIRVRAGYVFAENATNPNPGPSAGGVTPAGLQNAIQYVQALLPAINQHRITGGVGVKDVLPGIDFDLFAGGMFEADESFGALTSASLQSYWVGLGITWRFGRGHCCDMPVADDWCLQ